MSKMDDLRAMREARYEQAAARAATTNRTPRRPAPVPPVAPPLTGDVGQSGAVPAAALCGHRAISGRTCTREHGHAAKSHRYS